ncbi:MAG TPA: right-handed parallel beta-helix repeat-containing protein [Verrucomicrobiae bacterium]
MSLKSKAYARSLRKFLSALILACLIPSVAFATTTVVSVPPAAGGDGIQKALDSLSKGGEVDLGEGTYVVHQPIILQRDGQMLHGAGQKTVLYLADKANCPVVVLGSPVVRASGPVTGLAVSDLLIDGNRKNQPVEMWRAFPEGCLYNNGIDVWNVDGANVAHVVCCRCRSGGLVSTARTRRLTVSDFTSFGNQFDGLACYSTEDSHFSNLNLHDNLGAGISLDLDFNHNIVDGAILSDNDLGVFMRQSKNNTFAGMKINKSRHHGVFMAQTVEGNHPMPGSECVGNSFEKLLVTNCGGRAFLVNDATCVSNSIVSSQFVANAQGGLSEALKKLVAVRDLEELPTLNPASDHENLQSVPVMKQGPAQATPVSFKSL